MRRSRSTSSSSLISSSFLDNRVRTCSNRLSRSARAFLTAINSDFKRSFSTVKNFAVSNISSSEEAAISFLSLNVSRHSLNEESSSLPSAVATVAVVAVAVVDKTEAVVVAVEVAVAAVAVLVLSWRPLISDWLPLEIKMFVSLPPPRPFLQPIRLDLAATFLLLLPFRVPVFFVVSAGADAGFFPPPWLLIWGKKPVHMIK